MVEVRVGVDDAHQGQAVGLQAGEDLVRVAAWVDDDGFFAERVADQGAVALQRAYGEGFADEGGLGKHLGLPLRVVSGWNRALAFSGMAPSRSSAARAALDFMCAG